MHELSLMRDLMAKIQNLAAAHNAIRVTKIKVKLGPLSHMTSEHFKEHYDQVAIGTIAENAAIEIGEYNESGPYSQDVFLEGIEIEDHH